MNRFRIREARETNRKISIYTAVASVMTLFRPQELDLVGLAEDTQYDFASVARDPENIIRAVGVLGYFLSRVQYSVKDRYATWVLLEVVANAVKTKTVLSHSVYAEERPQGLSNFIDKLQDRYIADWIPGGESNGEEIDELPEPLYPNDPEQDEAIDAIVTYSRRFYHWLIHKKYPELMVSGNSDEPPRTEPPGVKDMSW